MDAKYINRAGQYTMSISKNRQFNQKLYSYEEVHILVHCDLHRYLRISDTTLTQYDMTHRINYFGQYGMGYFPKEMLQLHDRDFL